MYTQQIIAQSLHPHDLVLEDRAPFSLEFDNRLIHFHFGLTIGQTIGVHFFHTDMT